MDLSKKTLKWLFANAKPFRLGNVTMYEASRKELSDRGYTIVGLRWESKNEGV